MAATSLGMATDRARSEAGGYQLHLLKPFPPAELDAALQQAQDQSAN